MELLNNLLVKSDSGDYRKIVKVIKNYLVNNTDAKIDLIQNKKEKLKTNIVAIFGEPKILINCHLDTVLPSPEWTYLPYKTTIKENKIYGLGTTDVKGSIYCVLEMVKEIKPKNLMLLFSYDEEALGIESGVTDFLKSKYALQIKNAIVCEPTNSEVVTKHKGYYSYFVHYKGNAKHSSLNFKPEENAIYLASIDIKTLMENGFNVGKIEGGTGGNILSENCKYLASIRNYCTNEDNTDFLYKLLKNQDKIEERAILPFFNNESVKGKEVSFWTEAALFQQYGIETIVCGAGNIAQAHTKDEYIEIEELKKFKKFLRSVMKGGSYEL